MRLKGHPNTQSRENRWRAEGVGVVFTLDPTAARLGDFWGVYHSPRLPTW